APELQALRQKYGKQPERLQREMTALYKREGTSMFAPLLLQWPFLSVMYLLFRSPQVDGTANTLLSRDLFGVPLGMHWLSGAGAVSAQGAVFLGVFALMAGLCWLSARLGRLMTAGGAQAAARAQAARGGRGAAVPAAAGGPGLLARVLPYLTVVFAAFVPLAAGIYLLTSLAWSLAERGFYWRRAAPGKGWAALSTDRGTPRPEVPSGAAQLTQSRPRRRAAASGK
ncbi:MAG TPA: YidC/Oxa1 family membrane protein insertase, partial [Streptosporangiaceae bacterium]|nr:YidC/Oxa1 family membrane protein insertase [Streptosporangiaceae bacterium]